VQEPAENDTLEARDTHLEDLEHGSDDESSLFIPGTPLTPSSKAFGFVKAFAEGQEKSVFNEGSEGPPNPPPISSNVPTLPTTQAPTPIPSGRLRLRSHTMRPILGQKQYNALDTDFEVVAQAYNTLQTKHGNLEKAREVADLHSSVAELQSENELLHCVVEETSEENKQLKDRIKELLEQQESQTKR
jgi:hypothetical protein